MSYADLASNLVKDIRTRINTITKEADELVAEIEAGVREHETRLDEKIKEFEGLKIKQQQVQEQAADLEEREKHLEKQQQELSLREKTLDKKEKELQDKMKRVQDLLS